MSERVTGTYAALRSIVVTLLLLVGDLVHSQPRQDGGALEVGAFLQTTVHASGDPGAEGEGLGLERVRLSAEGQPTSRLDFEMEADFAAGFELKDARVGVRLHPALTLQAGQYKVPFSYAYLGSSRETPFVRRPRVSDALRVGRRIGLEVQYRSAGGAVALQGGIFDREAGTDPASDPAPLLFAGRAAWAVPLGDARVSFGANAVYEGGADSLDTPTGLRYGGDVHAEVGRAFITAEILALADPRPGVVASGLYVMGGYTVTGPHRVRALLDHVAPHGALPDALGPRTLLGAGYTFAPASPLRFEVDLLVPTTGGFARTAAFASLEVDI